MERMLEMRGRGRRGEEEGRREEVGGMDISPEEEVVRTAQSTPASIRSVKS